MSNGRDVAPLQLVCSAASGARRRRPGGAGGGGRPALAGRPPGRSEPVADYVPDHLDGLRREGRRVALLVVAGEHDRPEVGLPQGTQCDGDHAGPVVDAGLLREEPLVVDPHVEDVGDPDEVNCAAVDRAVQASEDVAGVEGQLLDLAGRRDLQGGDGSVSSVRHVHNYSGFLPHCPLPHRVYVSLRPP